MEIPLDGEIEQVVLAKVAAGEYRSVSELVEEALFLLVERDWMAAQRELREQAPTIFDLPADKADEGEAS